MPRPRECGFANPPADGTAEREIIDRFSEFLREVGPPATKDKPRAPVSAAKRYRIRFLIWKMEQPVA